MAIPFSYTAHIKRTSQFGKRTSEPLFVTIGCLVDYFESSTESTLTMKLRVVHSVGFTLLSGFSHFLFENQENYFPLDCHQLSFCTVHTRFKGSDY